MFRKTLTGICLAAAVAVPVWLAHGHGGSVPPPSGGCYRGPRDMAPPVTGTAGPASPSTPAAKPNSPQTGRPTPPPRTGGGGAPPVAPGGAPRGAVTATAGKKRAGATSLDRWELWWQHNREPYLVARRESTDGSTAGSAFLTGLGRRDSAPTHVVPSAEEVHGTIVPALVAVLTENEPIIVDSALMAIGRIAAADRAAPLVATVTDYLASTYPSVREAAILALGILGHRSAVPILWSVMNDTGNGRRLLGRTGGVVSMDRAIGALALGFVCDESLVPQLETLIERLADDDPEVAAGAVLSLGMVTSAGTTIVPFLAGLLDEERLDRRVQAQVPIALARIGAAAVPLVPRLVQLVATAKTDPMLRHSAAIALGRLAAPFDREAIDGLKRLIRDDNDGLLRHFSLMALGRIGARVVTSGENADVADRVRAYLVTELVDPSHGIDRPWAMLAAGVMGHAYPRYSPECVEIGKELSRLLKRSGNPSDEGAAAIALGLVGERDAGPMLLERLEARSSAELRGFLALGLGLMSHTEAVPALRKILAEDNDSRLRVDAATALDLLGDRTVAADLLEMLEAAPTFAATASIGRALGRTGDQAVVADLVALVIDRNRRPEVRGFGCVALGLIAEKSELPWNAPLSIDSNYASGLTAQQEVLDIF